MKHSLQLRLSQHLTLTPQLQQSIRLLQLSTLELTQEIERMLQENPMLEREEGSPGEEPGAVLHPLNGSEAPAERTADAGEISEPRETDNPEVMSFDGQDGDGDYRSAPRDDNDEAEYPQVAAESQSLREHLLIQVSMLHVSDRDRKLVALLVDSLDDDGYLHQDLTELAALLPEELDIEPEDLTVALRHLQYLDPPGVGARSLAECLALQLETLPADTPQRDFARTVIHGHLELLAARDFNKLKKLLSCDDVTLKAVQSLITGLNPRPGASFAGGEARYVIPDVIVKKVKGVWLVALNPDAMPKLRINRLYAAILSRSRDSGHQQLASQLQEAKWLIKNVQQRFDTILRVSQAIVDRQRHFFEHGEVAMRPLVLREIAETLNLHESTVSRVTTQKFILTPRGIFELKYFFGSHVTTETGGAASSTAIRALIKQLVTAENTKKPLSDSQLSEILGQQGIVVARRTVAKYRESMHILPVNLRKSL